MMQGFLAWLRDHDKSDNTVTLYRKLVASFAAWYATANGQPLTPTHLTPTDVRQYREALIRDGRKPSSINATLAALRAFGQWIAETHGGPNPAERVKSIATAQPTAPKSLDKQAQYKLRQALDRRAAYAERRGHSMAWIHRDAAIITRWIAATGRPCS